MMYHTGIKISGLLVLDCFATKENFSQQEVVVVKIENDHKYTNLVLLQLRLSYCYSSSELHCRKS